MNISFIIKPQVDDMLPGTPHPVILLPIDGSTGRPTIPSASEPLLYFTSVT